MSNCDVKLIFLIQNKLFLEGKIHINTAFYPYPTCGSPLPNIRWYQFIIWMLNFEFFLVPIWILNFSSCLLNFLWCLSEFWTSPFAYMMNCRFFLVPIWIFLCPICLIMDRAYLIKRTYGESNKVGSVLTGLSTVHAQRGWRLIGPWSYIKWIYYDFPHFAFFFDIRVVY